MKHRDRFTTPEDLAAYDEGYRLGLSEEQVDLPHGGTKEEVALRLVTLIGVCDGLQEQMAELKRKQRGSDH